MKTSFFKIMTQRFAIGLSMALMFLSYAFPQITLTQVAQAATGVPETVSYQGRLTDSSGQLLGGAGTNYYFKFSIWDDPTVGSGSKVWPAGSPGTTTANVSQGVFNVNIGDTANGYPDALNFDFQSNDTVYLQVEVSPNFGGPFETLSPRQQISSSGYAINAGSVQGRTPGTGANNILTLDGSGDINIGGDIITSGNLQGASGNITGSLDVSGVIQAGAGNVNITLADGSLNAAALGLITGGGSGATSSGSGLEVVSNQLGLLQGCADNNILKWNDSLGVWACAVDASGVSSISLQNAYDTGNSITSTDAKDIDIVLADTATDSNLDIDLIADNTVSISRNDGASTEAPSQLLLLENLDTDLTIAAGVLFNVATGGALTTAIDASDSDIVTAIAIGSNDVTVGGATISAAEFAALDNGISLTSEVTGILPAANGGTGVDTSAAGNGTLLIGTGSGLTLATLTQGSGITVTNGSGSITLASTLGTSVDLTSEITGVLPVANGGTGASSLNDLITLGTHTVGNYVATITGNSQIGVSGSGSENAGVGLSINGDSIGASQLASTLTFADGDLIDLSSINTSSTSEGLKLPQATSCAAGTAEGQICWDTDGDFLSIGTGSGVATLLSAGSSLFTAAATSGSNSTISQGGTLTIAAGSGITTTGNGSGTITIASTLGTSVDLTSEITGVLPVANGGTGASSLNDLITLGTHTTGNYVSTIAGSSQISVSGSGSENAAVTLGIVADSIGDTQLAFNTGQNLTTASSPTFAGLTSTGSVSIGSTFSPMSVNQPGLTINQSTNNITGLAFRNSTNDTNADARFSVENANSTASFVFSLPSASNTQFELFGMTRSSSAFIFSNGTGRNIGIGTLTSNYLAFGTDNTERMRITATGDVGIGTDAPESLLEIQATEGNSAILTLDADDGDNGTDTWQIASDAATNNLTFTNATTEIGSLSSSGALQLDSLISGGAQCLQANSSGVISGTGSACGTAVGTLFTVAATSGSNSTISAGDTLTVAAGSGITTTGNGSGTITIASTLGTSVDLTSEVTGILPVANGGTGASSLNNLITLGTHTTGNYVATIAGNTQVGVSGSGSENASVSLSINTDSITASQLSGTLTFADGDLIDLSSINTSSTSEGLKLPQSTSCTSGTAEGQICWDTDGDFLSVGTGSGVSTLLSTGSSLFTAAGTSGSSQTISAGDTLTIAAGAGITTTGGATDTITIASTLGTSVDLTSEITGVLPVANGGTGASSLANLIALGTDTTGNYIATIAGSSQISVSGSGSENAAVTLGIVVDSIGDTQLAFNTGQNLTTADSPEFTGLTLSGLSGGGAQCLQIDNAGVIGATGDTCGTSTGISSLQLTGSTGSTQTLNDGDTITIAAGSGITTTAGATDTVTIAATLGTSVDLTSEVTGILPTANGGTGTATAFTEGSVVFAGSSGIYTEDNANFFYDGVSHFLGIGTNAPSESLQVAGNAIIGESIVGGFYTAAPLALVNSAGGVLKTQLNLVNTGGGGGAGSAIDFYTYTTAGNGLPEARIGSIDDGNYSASLSFYTKDPGNTGNNGLVNRLQITAGGSVGIGDDTPAALLTVGSSDAFQVDNSGVIASASLAGAGTQCLQADNSGVISGTGAGCVVAGGTLFTAAATSGSNSTISQGGTLTVAAGSGITTTGNGSGTITIASTLGTSVDLTSEVTGVLPVANGGTGASSLANLIALATDTTGNYVATIAGNTQIGVSGSGSENASVSLSINGDSITASQLSGTLTFADGDLIDLSSINTSSTSEGLKLPQSTSCASGTAEGQICWDTDGDFLSVGTGSGVSTLLATGSSLFTAAGTSGSNSTISQGGTLTVAAGSGITTTGNGSGTITIASTLGTSIDLTSEVTGVLPVANGGTGTSTAFTTGSVVFAGASGTYTEDNANFFWDDSANQLGIGTTTPGAKLDLLSTTEQLRLGYNSSLYWTNTVDSTGNLDITGVGGADPFLTYNVGNTIFKRPATGATILRIASNGTDQFAGFYLTNNATPTDSANSAFGIAADGDQLVQFVGDAVGNAIVFTNIANRTKDHDHGLQTNPTLFIQSDTNPDTDNTQWLSLTHNKTDGVISTGKGDIILSSATGNVGIGTSSPESLLEVQATEGNSAILTLDADDGDDTADTWQIASDAATNNLTFTNDTAEIGSLSSSGALQLDSLISGGTQCLQSDSSGVVSGTGSACGTAVGTLFTAAGTSGSSQTISAGDTLTIAAGSGITTTGGATDTITIASTLGTSVDLTSEVTGILPVANGGTGASSLNDLIALGTDTTGNYVATITAGLGVSGSSSTEGGTPTIAFNETAALFGNLTLSANQEIFGLSGLIFEGSTADNIETFIAVTNPTSSDKTITFPDASGTVLLSGGSLFTAAATSGSNSTIAQGGTLTMTAGSGITTTGDGSGTITIASTLGTSVDLTSEVTGILPVANGGTGASSLNNLITLGTHTTGNYVATLADSGDSIFDITGSGSESAGVTIGVVADSIGDAQLTYDTGQNLTTSDSPEFAGLTLSGLGGGGPQCLQVDNTGLIGVTGDSCGTSTGISSLQLAGTSGSAQTLNDGDTITIAAGAGITTTGGATDTVTIAATLGTSVDLTSEVTGVLPVLNGGTGASSLADLIALGTDTTGNYVASIADSGDGIFDISGSGSETASVTIGITNDSIGDTQLAFNTGQNLTTSSNVTFGNVTDSALTAGRITFAGTSGLLSDDADLTYNATTNALTTTTFIGALTGNASTATALAANPTDCSANQFATAIAASGNLTCAAITDADVPNNITIDLATLASTVTVVDSTDATSFVALFDSATGSLAPKTDAGLLYNSSTAALSVTGTISASNFSGSSSGTNTGDQTITLTGDVTGSGTGSFTATIAANAVALGTDTTGNYLATLADSGAGTISVTGSGSENAAVTLGIVADSIGDTQLAFNTGQDLTTSDTPTFAGLTLSGISGSTQCLQADSSGLISGTGSACGTATGDLFTIAGTSGSSQTISAGDTLTIAAGSGITTTAGTTDTITIASTLGTSVDLTSEITGVLPLANGGTNKNLTASNGSIVYSDADSFELLAGGTSGRALISGGTSAPTWYAPTAGSVLFAGTSGILQQDNAGLFYDDSTNRLGIGDSSPDYTLEISDSANTPTVVLSDDDVNQPFTSVLQADGFLSLSSISTTAGGAGLIGVSDSDAIGFIISGGIGSTNPTDTTPAVLINGVKSDGSTGPADLGASETVLQIANNDNAPALTVLGNNNVGIGDATPTALLTVGSSDAFQVDNSGVITSASLSGSGTRCLQTDNSGVVSIAGAACLTSGGSLFTAAATSGSNSTISQGGTLTIAAGSGITTTGNGSGTITIASTLGTSVDLTSEVTGILPVANGGTGASSLNDLIALATDTTGNYVATIAGSSQVSVSGSGSENAAVTLGIVADSIGDTQLAFNTGQNLTTADSPTFAGLTVNGSVTLANSETISNGTNSTVTFGRNDAGTVTINAADNDSTAALTILPGGAAALTLGGASTTAITLTTDGTGDAEVVLPTGSIGTTEILDNTVSATDLAAALTFADGDFLNLSAINTSSTSEGLRLPQATSCTAGTAEGQICWDTDGDFLSIGTGSGVSTILSTATTLFTLAGTSGSNQTITAGDTVTIAAGAGITTTGGATDTVTIASTLGTSVDLTSEVTGILPVANGGTGASSLSDLIALATDTTGNYVATIAGNTQIGVSGSGSENASVSLSINGDSITASQLSSTLTFADGDLLDLSAINTSSTSEGLKLPQSTSCTSGTAEGQICWDTDGDFLSVGTGSGVSTLLSAGSSLFTAASTSGSNSTISQGGTLTVAAGSGITTTGNGSGTITIASTLGTSIDLTSEVTGVLPVANGGTGTSTAFTTGSVVFAGASGTYAQDNANFFWDDSNNFLGIGDSSPDSPLNVEGTTTASGSGAVAGVLTELTLTNSTASGFQFGNRNLVTVNGSTAGTEVGQFIRTTDNTALSNTVRGLEVQAYSGSNTSGINTGITAYGKTFGIQGVTTATAGGVAAPAAVFADLDNGSAATAGNAIRAYTDNATSADLVSFYQETSSFSGAGLIMDFGNSSGSFTGNFLDLKVAGSSKLSVSSAGAITTAGTTTYSGVTTDITTGSGEDLTLVANGAGIISLNDSVTIANTLTLSSITGSTQCLQVDSSGVVSGTGSACGSGGGGITSFTLAGTSGSSQTITDGNTLTIAAGAGITTTAGATDTVTIASTLGTSVDLTSEVTGVLPVANGGTGTGTAFTAGSVVFAGASGVYTQDNANFFWDDSTNHLGIGDNTPTEGTLTVGGTADISGHAAIGADASVDDIDSGSGHQILLNLAESFTDLATNDFIAGIGNFLSINPSADDDDSSVTGISNWVETDGANDVGYLTGSSNIAYHGSDGDLVQGEGLYGDFTNDGAGTVDTAYGIRAVVDNNGSGTISNAYTFYTYTPYNDSGTIDNGYGIYLGAGGNSGTYNNVYGLYIEDQSGIASGDDFNIYSAGASSINYFAGNVGIGTPSPSAKLEVAGNILLNSGSDSVLLKPTGAGHLILRDLTDSFNAQLSTAALFASDSIYLTAAAEDSRQITTQYNTTDWSVILSGGNSSGTRSGGYVELYGSSHVTNADQVVINGDNGGNVGIGNTSPSELLTVGGGGEFTVDSSGVITSASLAGAGTQCLQADNSGVISGTGAVCGTGGGGITSFTLAGTSGSSQTITDGNTLTIAAGAGITTTAGATDTVTIASTLGTSVDLTSEITGVLPLANGGTNKNLSVTQGGILWTDSDSFEVSAAGTTGQALISGGTGAPTWFAPTAGSVLFAGTSGVLQQDNSKLFWDDSAHRLGIGNNTPGATLDIDVSTSSDFSINGLYLNLTDTADSADDTIIIGNEIDATIASDASGSDTLYANYVSLQNSDATSTIYGNQILATSSGSAIGERISIQQNDDSDATDASLGLSIDLNNVSGDAGDTLYGIVVTNKDRTANQITDALIKLDNEETTAGTVPDAIIITSSGVNSGITDAIDASASNIDNAINVGANTILGTTGVIDFTNFDVASSGQITLTGVTTDITTGSGEDLTLVANGAGVISLNDSVTIANTLTLSSITGSTQCLQVNSSGVVSGSGAACGVSGTIFTAAGTSGSSQTISAGDTLTIAAGSGITTTGGATDTITIASTLGTSVDLTSEVTGVLPLANGGTNKNLTAANGSIVYSDADSFELLAGGTSGRALISGGSSAPSWYAPTAGSVLFAGTSGILQQDNSNLFFDDSTNHLGIGDNTPTEGTLTVGGTVDISGHVAIGGDAAVDAGFSTQKLLLDLEESFDDLATNNYIGGIESYIYVEPTADDDDSVVTGIDNNVATGGTKDVGFLTALNNFAYHNSDGDLIQGTGVYGSFTSSSAGTVTTAYGISADLENASSGTINNAYTFYTHAPYNGLGTINNGYGIFVGVGGNTGTYNNAYGLYIEDQSGIASGDDFNIYSAGSDSLNYFAGSVGIGTDDPQADLHISTGAPTIALFDTDNSLSSLNPAWRIRAQDDGQFIIQSTDDYSIYNDRLALDNSGNLQVVSLATGGASECLQADASGQISTTGSACGAGGGGMSIGGTITSGTTGSILFVGGSSALTQDNSNFFWDDSNNFLGLGVNSSLKSRLNVVGTTTASGADAIAGTYSSLTLTNSTSSGFQFGNRLLATVNGSVAGTEVGQFIRMTDNTSLANTVRGLEVQAYSGTNNSGINTGIAAFGKTFGIQAETTAQAGSVVQAAAVFADLNNSSDGSLGNAIRAFSDDATSATLVSFTQNTSTFTGTGLNMNFAASSGSFTGNFIDLQKNGTSKLVVDDTGEVLISIADADNAPAIYINTEESTNTQTVWALESDTTNNGQSADAVKAHFNADGSLYVSFTGTGTANAVCHTGSGSANNDQLVDCTSTPAADYAEMYPVTSGIEVGEVVMLGQNTVNTYDQANGVVDWTRVKGTVKQLVRADQPYNGSIMGVVSDNYGDFISTGYNIKPEDNPKSVALNGRVPVRVNLDNGAIRPGDWLTASRVPGVAMRADKPGTAIGQALAAYDGTQASNLIMVFVHTTYYDPTTLVQDDGSIVLQRGAATTTLLANSGNTAFLVNQSGIGDLLSLQSSGADRFLVKNNGAININAVSADDTDRIAVIRSNDEDVFTVSARGEVAIKGNIIVRDDSFAGSVATEPDGTAKISFTYDLGTGKPSVQLTPESESPVFAQIKEWKTDSLGRYTGFTIETFGLGGAPTSAIVHYLVVGKEEDYDTVGSVIEVVNAPNGQSADSGQGNENGDQGTGDDANLLTGDNGTVAGDSTGTSALPPADILVGGEDGSSGTDSTSTSALGNVDQ